MSRIRCGMVFFVLVFVVALTGVAHANLIVNGSFENGEYSPINQNSWVRVLGGETKIAGWVVGGAGVDWHNETQFVPIAFGDRAVDLNFQGPSLSTTLSQSFSTETGAWYTLDFYMAAPEGDNSGNRQVKVSVGGVEQLFSKSPASNTNLSWQLFSLNFQASNTTTTLTFSNPAGTGGYWGPVLDNVSVEAVPEPATMLLLGSGLVGIAAFRRKSSR